MDETSFNPILGLNETDSAFDCRVSITVKTIESTLQSESWTTKRQLPRKHLVRLVSRIQKLVSKTLLIGAVTE